MNKLDRLRDYITDMTQLVSVAGADEARADVAQDKGRQLLVGDHEA